MPQNRPVVKVVAERFIQRHQDAPIVKPGLNCASAGEREQDNASHSASPAHREGHQSHESWRRFPSRITSPNGKPGQKQTTTIRFAGVANVIPTLPAVAAAELLFSTSIDVLT